LRGTACGARGDLSAKFGAEPADAVDLVAYAIENGVRVNGLSFHVGSQTNSARPYRAAISQCLWLIDQIRLGLDHELGILDIGGGFPVAYRDGVCNADDIIESISTLLTPHADRLTVLAEPGRYVVASCMTLITTVIGAATRQAAPPRYWRPSHQSNDGRLHPGDLLRIQRTSVSYRCSGQRVSN